MNALWWLLITGPACTDDTNGTDTPPPDSEATDTDTGPVFACPQTSTGDPIVASTKWEQLPFAPAGDILDFATTAADPDRVYAVSAINGVFRSDDAGLSWFPLDSDITHVLAQTTASPNDEDLVFHSSGELFRSTNGGYRWDYTGIGTREFIGYVRGLTWVGDDLLAIEGSAIVHRSQDLGETWTSISKIEQPFHADYYTIDDSYWFMTAVGETVYALREFHGAWRSVDAGLTWEQVSSDRVHVNTLGASGDRAWFARHDAILWSEDGGETFADIGTEGQEFQAAVELADGSVLWFTDNTVWRLADQTLTPWAVPELDLGTIRTAVRLESGAVLLGHETGIARSDDDGLTWSDASEGLVDDDLAVMTAHSQCSNWLFVGTQCESGGYTSSEAGENLTLAPVYMHYVMVAKESPHDPSEIWVTTDDRVYRTQDLGISWELAVPDSLHVHFHGLDQDPFREGTILIGSVGSGTFYDDRPRVYRTDDDGLRWKDSSEGLPDGDYSVHSLHFSREHEGVVLLGTYRGGDIRHDGPPGVGMYRSVDRGETWAEVPLDGVLDVAKFAECDGRIYAAVDTGILVSDNAGATWDLVRSSTVPYLALACLPGTGTVIAFDQGTGLYRSEDHGETWESWTDDEQDFRSPSDNYLFDLAISADGATAWAVIRGHGLWRRAL